ncbi:MAG: lactonase family protein [Acidobacteria bacterium]|nr:lactonase family protein [Acidobacteriota bacterium]
MTNRRQFLGTTAGALAAGPLAAAGKEYFVYFGTYTNQNRSKGIYVSRFNTGDGKLTAPELAGEVVNPSFLAIHWNRKYLYSVSETAEYNGQRGGSVTAFAIDRKSGKLTRINEAATKGGAPCHLNVDKTGRNLLTANYGNGSVAVFPVNPDGSVRETSSFVQHQGSSVDQRRQQGPHAHSINLSADNRFAVVADLGLDQVLVYRFDPVAGTLSPNDPPFAKVNPGGGPRHFVFHPSGKFAYTNLEMGSAVSAMTYDKAKGVFNVIQTVPTLPAGYDGSKNSTAEVQVHPSGKFVYCSNRGHNSIAIFRVDPSKGTLEPAGHANTGGEIPRNFGIAPGGEYVIAANQNTDNVVVFRVNTSTGALTGTGQVEKVGMPVCVKFMAIG